MEWLYTILAIIWLIGVVLIILIFAVVHERNDTYRFRDVLFILLWPFVLIWLVGKFIIEAYKKPI